MPTLNVAVNKIE